MELEEWFQAIRKSSNDFNLMFTWNCIVIEYSFPIHYVFVFHFISSGISYWIEFINSFFIRVFIGFFEAFHH